MLFCCLVIGIVLWFIGRNQGTEFVSISQLQDGAYLNVTGKMQKLDITIPEDAVESIVKNIPRANRWVDYHLYSFQMENDTVLMIAAVWSHNWNLQSAAAREVIARSKMPPLDACINTYEIAHSDTSFGNYVLFHEPTYFDAISLTFASAFFLFLFWFWFGTPLSLGFLLFIVGILYRCFGITISQIVVFMLLFFLLLFLFIEKGRKFNRNTKKIIN